MNEIKAYSISVKAERLKLIRRLTHLQAGRRYMIIVLTLPADGDADWTV